MLAHRLNELFKGNEVRYGVSKVGTRRDANGKLAVICNTPKGSPTPELWADHINGKGSLGVAPARHDGLCFFAAIDVDNYQDDHTPRLKMLDRWDMPFFPCLSKSGGLHIYMFFNGVKTPAVRALMKAAAALLGCSPQVEIFPKQDRVNTSGNANWINMPYFGTTRPCLDAAGNPVPLADFVDRAEALRVNADTLTDLGLLLVLDGPKCLHGYVTGAKAQQSHNVSLSYSSYLRKSSIPEERAKRLYHKFAGLFVGGVTDEKGFNAGLGFKELYCVNGTCSEACKTKVKEAVSRPELDLAQVTLTKVEVEPLRYLLHYPERPDVVLDSDDLGDPSRIGRACREKWNRVLRGVPHRGAEWDNALDILLGEMKIVTMPSEATHEGAALKEVAAYALRAAQDLRPGTDPGFPWLSKGRLFFTLDPILSRLKRQKDIQMDRGELAMLLAVAGYTSEDVQMGERVVSAWSTPAPEGFQLPDPKQEQEHDEPF